MPRAIRMSLPIWVSRSNDLSMVFISAKDTKSVGENTFPLPHFDSFLSILSSVLSIQYKLLFCRKNTSFLRQNKFFILLFYRYTYSY